MAFWKQKYNQTEGFSLVEVMVSIAILGFVVVPMLTGLLFSYRLNQRSNEKLQAQLAVSNAVETIMAEGFNSAWYDSTGNNRDEKFYHNRFPGMDISGEKHAGEAAYELIVISDKFSDICVTTYARPYAAPPGGGS